MDIIASSYLGYIRRPRTGAHPRADGLCLGRLGEIVDDSAASPLLRGTLPLSMARYTCGGLSRFFRGCPLCIPGWYEYCDHSGWERVIPEGLSRVHTMGCFSITIGRSGSDVG